MTKYVDQLVEEKEKRSFQGLTIYGLIFLCIVLIIALYKNATKPQPIYYISGVQAGFSYPNDIPDSAISSFAMFFVLTNANYTPVTIKDCFDLTSKYMSPELLAYSNATVEGLIKKVKDTNLSSQYSVTNDPVLEKTPVGYKVVMTGWETLYYGGQKVSDSKVKYELVLKRVTPMQNNPFGMVVCSIQKAAL